MMKRNKAILCALAGIGFITSVGTVKANAMTMKNDTTTKCIQKLNKNQVEDLMWKLDYNTININFKDQVRAMIDIIDARIAYNSLSEKDKKRVDSDALYNLEYEESLLKNVLKDEAKALGLICRIVKIEQEVDYNRVYKTINKQKLESNKESIRKEIISINEAYKNIDYSIKYSKGLSQFMNELNVIELKLV